MSAQQKIVQPDTDSEVITNQGAPLLTPVCDCIAAVNKVLEPDNGRLGTKGSGRSAVPIVFVRRINPTGDTPPTIIPRFCPFCGEAFDGARRRAKRMVGIPDAADAPMTVIHAIRVLLCTSQFSLTDADAVMAHAAADADAAPKGGLDKSLP